MYDVVIMSLPVYISYQVNRHGWKKLLSLTNSGYPRICALGVCYYSTEEIVVAKVFNWRLRLEHEQGHERGLVHTNKIGYVMHPWGLLRGDKYI